MTPLTLPSEEVWRTYNGRADRENRIKEFKPAFGAHGLSSRRFSATEPALRFRFLLHNLIAEFQRCLGPRPICTLATQRTPLFACGAIRGAEG